MIPLQTAPILPMSPSGQSDNKLSSVSEVGTSFGDMLNNMVQDVSAQEQNANKAMQQLHAGGEISLHEAMLSIEKADIAMRYLVQVRNRALEAYQEISRLQV